MTILQSATNDLIFYKKSGISSPYYLVRLVNRITAKEFVFLDQSPVACPFISLQLIEVGRTGTELPLNASIKVDTGSYDIYLYDQVSSTNLDYTLTNSLLYEGEAYVYSDEDLDRTFL
jgi:hypothetical protein